MYCTKCGTPRGESAQYCTQCGNAFDSSPIDPAAAPASTPNLPPISQPTVTAAISSTPPTPTDSNPDASNRLQSMPGELKLIIALLGGAGALLLFQVLRAFPPLFDLLNYGNFGQALALLLIVLLGIVGFFGVACLAIAILLYRADRAGRGLAYVLCGSIAFGIIGGKDHSTGFMLAMFAALGVIAVLALSSSIEDWFCGPFAPQREEPSSIVVARTLAATVVGCAAALGLLLLLASSAKSSYAFSGLVALGTSIAAFCIRTRVTTGDPSARTALSYLLGGCALALLIADTGTGMLILAGLSAGAVGFLWLPKESQDHFATERPSA